MSCVWRLYFAETPSEAGSSGHGSGLSAPEGTGSAHAGRGSVSQQRAASDGAATPQAVQGVRASRGLRGPRRVPVVTPVSACRRASRVVRRPGTDTDPGVVSLDPSPLLLRSARRRGADRRAGTPAFRSWDRSVRCSFSRSGPTAIYATCGLPTCAGTWDATGPRTRRPTRGTSDGVLVGGARVLRVNFPLDRIMKSQEKDQALEVERPSSVACQSESP